MAQTVVIDIAARLQDQTSAGVQKVKENVDRLGKSIEKMKKQMSKMRKSEVALNVKDKATQAIEKISKTVSSLGRKTWNVSVRVLDKATAPLKGILNMLKNPILQAGTVLGISLGGANTFQTYQGFEKSMSNVKALSGANASDTAELTKLAREMGKTTTKSASEAADALGYMALAGWNKDQMKEAIQPVLRLSEAGNLDLGRTSDLVTDSMSSLGIGTGDLKGYLDKVAKTASSSNTNIDAMMEAFLEFGGTVKNNGIAHDEASALIGILANRGVKGSEAGTALNSVLTNLTSGTGLAGKAMKELGLSAYDSEHKFKGYANVLKELNEKTKDLNDEEKQHYFSAIGGKTRLSDVQKLVAGVSGEYDELKEKIANSNGALEEMANIMNDNIYGDVKALQSAVESVQLDFMDKFQPSARKFLQWSKDLTLSFGQKLTKAAEKFQYRVEKIESTIKEFKSSKEWQNADLSGKIGIAWDKIIAEPFAAWWSSEGKTWACGVANDIGYGISSALTAGISTLLGIDLGEAADSGFDIGKSFAEGFINGFDGSKIWEGIKEKSKELVVNASKILPGGEQATGGSWLSAGLLAYGGMKVKRMFSSGVPSAPIPNPNSNPTPTPTPTQPSVPPPVGGGGLLSKLLGNASAGTGILGLGTKIGTFLSAGSGGALSAGATSALGLGSIAGGVLGLAGIVKSLKDFESEHYARGASKLGMVGGGAAIGALIGGVVPGAGHLIGGLLGAGVGGIGALLSGDKFFKTKEEKQQEAIQKNIGDTQAIRSNLKNANDLIWETEHLKNIWKDIKRELDKTDLSEEDRLQKQQELNDITERFVALYPDMISKEDIINGKIEDRIAKIQEYNRANKELQRVNLRQTVLENEKNADKMKQDYIDSKKEVSDLQKKEQGLESAEKEISDIILENKTLKMKMESFEKNKTGNTQDWIDYGNNQKKYEKNERRARAIMKENNISAGLNDGMYIPEDIEGTALKAIKFQQNNTLPKYSAAMKKENELQIEIKAESEAALNLIEMEYGEPIEQAIGKYDEMDATSQKVLENAIRKVLELKDTYGELPDRINTELLFKIAYDGVQPQDMIKRLTNPLGTGINMAFDKFTNQSVDKKAMGGIINKPHLGIIGEAGAEAIIPLTGTNKYRGIALWQQTGELLGMLPKHAQGGIFGGSIDYKSMFDEAENKQQTTQSNSITINLGGMNFTFTGNTVEDKESIITTIRQQMPEIANEVAEAIAKELQKLLPNMKASIA